MNDFSPAEVLYCANSIIAACEILSYADPADDDTDIRIICDDIIKDARRIKELAERTLQDE